jgi:hypothetical protein
MAHNVLVLHAQLTSFPEVAFFVAPIPIHIAAMIILFAAISKVETLAWGLAKEDIALALKLVPLFRWRWGARARAQQQGTYPLVSRLAIKVFGSEVAAEQGPISPPILLDEMYWLSNDVLRSDRPAKIEEVWNPPASGVKPTPSGLGAAHHEQRRHVPIPTSLQQQQDLFVAATSGAPFTNYAQDSLIDIDRPDDGNRHADPTEAYDSVSFSVRGFRRGYQITDSCTDRQETIAALMTHLGDQQTPTDLNTAAAEVHPDPEQLGVIHDALRAASGHTRGGAEPDEMYDVSQDAPGEQDMSMQDIQQEYQ